MRLITSDNIENLTTYGKKTLGKFEDYVKKSEVFEQMTLEEKEALSRDVQSLKQSGTYTEEAEKQSRETILRARQELEQNRITPEDYRQLLKMPVAEPKVSMTEPKVSMTDPNALKEPVKDANVPPLKMEPDLEELEEYSPIMDEPEEMKETKDTNETKEPEIKEDGEGVKKIVLKP
jgi:hypothetical protein